MIMYAYTWCIYVLIFQYNFAWNLLSLVGVNFSEIMNGHKLWQQSFSNIFCGRLSLSMIALGNPVNSTTLKHYTRPNYRQEIPESISENDMKEISFLTKRKSVFNVMVIKMTCNCLIWYLERFVEIIIYFTFLIIIALI